MAGTAAAVIGTISTALGAGLGAALDRMFDGTVLPFTLGFLACGVIAAGIVLWVERKGSTDPGRVPEQTLGRAPILGG